MSEPELVAAVRALLSEEDRADYARKQFDSILCDAADLVTIQDALLNATTPAQRAAAAVLAGDTRPEVLAPILDELAERFAGGPSQ